MNKKSISYEFVRNNDKYYYTKYINGELVKMGTISIELYLKFYSIFYKTTNIINNSNILKTDTMSSIIYHNQTTKGIQDNYCNVELTRNVMSYDGKIINIPSNSMEVKSMIEYREFVTNNYEKIISKCVLIGY